MLFRYLNVNKRVNGLGCGRIHPNKKHDVLLIGKYQKAKRFLIGN